MDSLFFKLFIKTKKAFILILKKNLSFLCFCRIIETPSVFLCQILLNHFKIKPNYVRNS